MGTWVSRKTRQNLASFSTWEDVRAFALNGFSNEIVKRGGQLPKMASWLRYTIRAFKYRLYSEKRNSRILFHRILFWRWAYWKFGCLLMATCRACDHFLLACRLFLTFYTIKDFIRLGWFPLYLFYIYYYWVYIQVLIQVDVRASNQKCCRKGSDSGFFPAASKSPLNLSTIKGAWPWDSHLHVCHACRYAL